MEMIIFKININLQLKQQQKEFTLYSITILLMISF